MPGRGNVIRACVAVVTCVASAALVGTSAAQGAAADHGAPVKSKWTRHARTYTDGGKNVTVVYDGPVNYRDSSGEWRAVGRARLRLREQGGRLHGPVPGRSLKRPDPAPARRTDGRGLDRLLPARRARPGPRARLQRHVRRRAPAHRRLVHRDGPRRSRAPDARLAGRTAVVHVRPGARTRREGRAARPACGGAAEGRPAGRVLRGARDARRRRRHVVGADGLARRRRR